MPFPVGDTVNRVKKSIQEKVVKKKQDHGSDDGCCSKPSDHQLVPCPGGVAFTFCSFGRASQRSCWGASPPGLTLPRVYTSRQSPAAANGGRPNRPELGACPHSRWMSLCKSSSLRSRRRPARAGLSCPPPRPLGLLRVNHTRILHGSSWLPRSLRC